MASTSTCRHRQRRERRERESAHVVGETKEKGKRQEGAVMETDSFFCRC